MKPSEKLEVLVRKRFIPLICIFELTRRCNQKCRHCYIDFAEKPGNELSGSQVRSALSQLAAAGCLNLVFTGGEIFLRKDIMELCRYARKKGFDLRLFTNGSLMDERIAKELSEIGISGVEISLYGNRPTHDKITGAKGSFSRVLRAVGILKQHAVPVTVKCPITRLNYGGYKWIVSFARHHGIKYRFDPVIAPRDNGDTSILRYRLSVKQLKELYSDPLFAVEPEPSDGKPDLSCSAGVNMLAVGYDGKVYPCLQYLKPLGDISRQKLKKIWSCRNNSLARVRNLAIDKMPVCSSCGLAMLCQRCPGIALLEDKTLYGPSQIACTLAAIMNSTLIKNHAHLKKRHPKQQDS